MRRRLTAISIAIPFLSVIAGFLPAAHAVMTDADLCPGTGVECVVNSRVIVGDVEGIDVRPLTLHIKSSGSIVAKPSQPLTIKAGVIVLDKGGSIVGTVAAAKGNTLVLTTEAAVGGPNGAVTILGSIDASSVRLNGTGGDGGSIAVNAAGPCTIGGKVRANGTPSASIGGAGGQVSIDCGGIQVDGGASVEASGDGPGGLGGSVALNADMTNLSLAKKSKIRATGSGLDGGSVSLSTDSTDHNDACDIAGKILLDAKSIGEQGGSGGGLDISCGGDVNIRSGATISMGGMDGGGSVDLFSGGGLTIEKSTSIKSNASNGSGGALDMVAASNVSISGKIEARAGGLFPNDGSISITNGRDLILKKGAVLNVSAGRKDAQTGQIIIVGGVADGGTPPVMTIENGASLKANGYTSGMGGLDVDLSGSVCTLGGEIKASALLLDPAAIGFVCDVVTFDSKSKIQASSSGASGGSVSIDTTGEFSSAPGTCTLGGTISLKSMSQTTPDPNTGMPVVTPGRGGSVNANCGLDLSVGDRATIDVSAGGAQSVGGQISLSSNQPAHVKGSIKSTASGNFSRGGDISIGAPDVYLETSTGTLDVGAETGGSIEIVATDGVPGRGVAHVEKALSANGNFGGNISVLGCEVTVSSTGWLRADGSKVANSGGNNEIRAHNKLTIGGKLTALNGRNLLFVSPSTVESLAGTIKPAAVPDANLSACN